MQILENILLATDFTKSNNNAIESAICLAKTFQSKIFILHVLPEDVGNEKAMQLLDYAAKRELESLKERIEKEGVETGELILEHGGHLDRIIRTSERINANLILIGAGENVKNKNFKLGTTAEKIIERSDKPVMVIQSGNYLDIKKIICPIDFSDESKRAIKNAITLAHRFNAELIILSAYEPAYKGPLHIDMPWADQDEKMKARHQANFSDFLDDVNFTGLTVKKMVRKGDFASIIFKTIEKENVDFMVIGATGRTGLGRFFTGSVTEKVIREVPCSFVTIKDENFIELKLSAQIKDIETHFENARQLVKDGMYEEALHTFKICLRINEMHIPSLNGLASVHGVLGNHEKAEKYNQLAKDVMSRIWDQKIEAEARKYFS
jgi:universal stress protein E